MASDASGRGSRAEALLTRAGEVLFPAVIFALATLFHGADLGKYLDDWLFCRRDMRTLAIERLTDLGHAGFRRPLAQIISPLEQTLLWDYDRAAHLILIGAHAVNALLLWRLLLAIGCERRTAIGVALLFALYPAPHEAVFWSAILPTSLATAGVTLLALLQVRLAKAAGCAAPRTAVPLMAVMPFMAFAVCCLNEQPAMGILAFPALSLAVSARWGCASAARRWAVAIVPGFISGLAVLTYVCLSVSTERPGGFARPDEWTPRAELAGKAVRLAGKVVGQVAMGDFMRGALVMGWRSLREQPVLGLMFAAAVLGSGAMFARWWIRDHPSHDRARESVSNELDLAASTDTCGRGWRVWLVVFGVGLFVAGWIPAWVVRIYDADSRLCYPGAVGLAVALAACVDRMGGRRAFGSGARRTVRKMVVRAVGVGLVGAVAVAFAVMLVGLQRAYRERAVFVVMEASPLARTVPATGVGRFDRAFTMVWENPWCAQAFLCRQYRRADLRALPSQGWPGPAVLDVRKDGLRTARNPRRPTSRASDAEGFRVAWGLLVPIVIEEDGRVRVVTRIVVRDAKAGEEVFGIEPPLVKAAREAGGEAGGRIEDRTFVFVRPALP